MSGHLNSLANIYLILLSVIYVFTFSIPQWIPRPVPRRSLEYKLVYWTCRILNITEMNSQNFAQ